MKSTDAREYLETCVSETIVTIDSEHITPKGQYVTMGVAKAALEIAEKELLATITERAVAAFNKSCALMQDCRHCNGDCWCEDNFRALIANPEAALWKCDT